MSSEPKDFWVSARRVTEKRPIQGASDLSANSDVAPRIAISRAYYGAFHTVREYLESKRRNLGTRGVHQGALDEIDELASECSDEAIKLALLNIGTLLNNLRFGRERADYELRVEVTEEHAKRAVADTKTLIGLVQALL